ncbi:MAG: hypothetical protein A3G49_02835 [Candidatus Sungbacteria bacterium RIFCSPLOWO2_12_FULL_41_11]|uniref:Peptidase S9 prolyl oligopeptidase catalytic domain-containing protein n=1 Tax=Candidatus Sungbacteria bacterium RIFCSPLOWO2_12_FULL_41_11 TaxID=1802286 RepID=A0A1G2LTH0_9BACT|nr:MAG: hypothetical protein UV01_C0001G0075 [Parcubacteria group bacterium GW2011_GWA2_42_14]OHA00256.1 MAG: hypothetical protein A3D41_01855 [Candidatus Sungbacteria bacterium RIFCSPHIGHO2_02_FULL_41_12b]OHA14152.1 MAG: hypothetical protein A3G49_02835 [Candidatus Sungbacteria bacterium RIFCSPLOWO2_12_FULL_41_11]
MLFENAPNYQILLRFLKNLIFYTIFYTDRISALLNLNTENGMKAIRVLLLVLALAGCAVLYKPPPDITPKTVNFKEEIPIFSYKKVPLNKTITPAWNYGSKTHDVFNLSFDSAMPGESIKAEYWKNKAPGRKKLIIVLPIADSTRFPGEHYTNVMTSWNGNTEFNVLLLEDTRKISWLEELRNSEDEKEFLGWMRIVSIAIKNYVVDTRRLIDWAETRQELDSLNIGIIGASISSNLAALIMAADSRIKAGVFDKGGGSFADLFSYSKQQELKESRELVMKKFSWTRQKFDEKIRPILQPVEAINWAGRINPQKVLFLNAKYDTWIPKFSIENFWNALGKPERIEHKTEHKTAFLLSLTPFGGHYADFKIFNHFQKNLQ